MYGDIMDILAYFLLLVGVGTGLLSVVCNLAHIEEQDLLGFQVWSGNMMSYGTWLVSLAIAIKVFFL